MLDLSAAFDTVDHVRLLDKLKNNFNITGNALKWLTSYLANRTFAVSINDNYSCKMPSIYGVPQGSVLGPLLFIMYVNDLTELGDEFDLTIHSYADDTTLYITFNPKFDFEVATENIKRCLKKIDAWMLTNFLKLNMTKTQLLVCGKKRLLNSYDTKIFEMNNILGFEPSSLSVAKLLGVVLDQSLSFENMINETCRVCFFKLAKLRNLRSFLSFDYKLMLVKSFVISRIDYCNSLYACVTKSLLRKLQRVINACIRFIYNLSLKNRDLLQYYYQAHILPIEYRIQYKLCLMAFKTLNKRSPLYLCDLFHQYRPLRENLRSENDLWIINTNRHCQRSIAAKISQIWVRVSRLLNAFKQNLKTYLFKQAFQAVH